MKLYTIAELNEIYTNYKQHPQRGYKCGINGLDNIMRLDKSSLAILVSQPNNGKSTFLDFYTYKMYEQNKWKTLLLSFETPIARHVNQLMRLYGDMGEIADNALLFDTANIASLQALYNVIRDAKEQKNIDCVVIDTFTNLYPFIGKVDTYTIGGVLTELKKLANILNILVLVTAHPTKLQDDREIDAYSICGSSNFYNLSDFIFSLEIKGKREHDTELLNLCRTTLKTLKIRDNIDKGLVNESVTLQFNPYDGTYFDIPSDEPFYKEDAHELQRTLKAMADKRKQRMLQAREPQRITPTFFDDIKVSYYDNYTNKKGEVITLKQALEMGGEADVKSVIDKLRTIDKNTRKDDYRTIKNTLPTFTPSCICGEDKGHIDTLNKVICIDIDNVRDVEEVREKINTLPYVCYSSLSCGGNGLYCIIPIGEYKDKDGFKEYFTALQYEFANMGIEIDNSCKNVNRLRIVSYDNKEYYNYNAMVWTKRMTPTTPQKEYNTYHSDKESKNELSEEDRASFYKYMGEIEQDHLQLTKNHKDTLILANSLYYTFGDTDEAFNYLKTLRKQRKGMDESKLYNTWLSSIEYVDRTQANFHLRKNFFPMYWDAVREKK